MKKLLIILAVLLLSVVAALWFREQGGYVLLHVSGLSVQASLFLAAATLLAVIVLSHVLLRLLGGMARAPRSMRGWWARRRLERSRARMLRALQKLAEGDFTTAERDMVKTVAHTDTPLLHYLGAAWAAHRQGAERRRDHYLALADRASPDARLAVGLVQAQLYVEDAQWETAFATLNLLQERWPRQPRVLELLALTCRRLEEWERLLDLLPLVRRYAAFDVRKVAELERKAATGYLEQASRQGLDALARAWARLPRAIVEDDQVQLLYIEGRMQHDAGDPESEKLLRTGLRKRWDNRWVQCYGRLRMADSGRPLVTVEAWLRERPEDAELLLAAGRLAVVAGIWGRARSYLEASVSRGGSPEACYLLARMLEQLGESDKAAYQYRVALEQDGRFQAPAGLDELARHHQEELGKLRVVKG